MYDGLLLPHAQAVSDGGSTPGDGVYVSVCICLCESVRACMYLRARSFIILLLAVFSATNLDSKNITRYLICDNCLFAKLRVYELDFTQRPD